MFESGTVGVMHRTTEEWLAHPEGAHLAGTDLIEIRKVADGDPVPWTPDPTQPLSGIKALSLTHVIAGSTAARTLSEYGAEVLHIMRDQSFEHEAIWTDVNIGMRSANLDLNRPDQNAALAALVPDADVFIDGFSGRGIERLRLRHRGGRPTSHPGIVYLTMRGYSWDGPWKMVRTFDMEALATTGFTIAEGSGGFPDFGETFAEPEGDGPPPAFPPTLVMNDYIAGYLGGAGIIAALRRRAAEGGSYHVHVNLARAAMWYASLGTFASTDFEPGEENRMIAPETITFASPYGEVHRLAPMAKLSKTPGRWQEPLLTVRGSDRAGLEGPALMAAGGGGASRWPGAGAGGRCGGAGADLRDAERPRRGAVSAAPRRHALGRRRPEGGRGAALRALPLPVGHGALGRLQGRRAREDRHHLRRVLGRALPELFRALAVPRRRRARLGRAEVHPEPLADMFRARHARGARLRPRHRGPRADRHRQSAAAGGPR